MSQATVLAVASRALLEACEGLGLAKAQLLGAAGIDPAALDDPELRLPAGQADALWQAAYTQSQDPHLALRAAIALPFGHYPSLDYLAAHSSHIGGALTAIARYFALVDQRASLCTVELEDGYALIFAGPSGRTIPMPAQEYTFAVILSRLRSFTEPSFRVQRVEFSHAPPASDELHRAHFACELAFHCCEARMVLSHEQWHTPINDAQPQLRAILEQHAARLIDTLPELPEQGLVSQVLKQIRRGLDDDQTLPSIETCARRLGLGEKTLQRRLRDEGLRYAELCDAERRARAEQLLRDPRVAVAEVAWLLDYSEQSAFSRAFRRWTGQSPGQWRAQTVA